ncbi:beta-glucuronidase-like [Diaphorina citri]|uniref:Beta-glucuronidase n=1 Tax=Diaphorina citri TaxID=121845 RepID=A0A3Q0J250_DIACI|nr:beta-glucuronidase-like [Diaphorina citri]
MVCVLWDSATGGILYPRESESREVRSLDGIWNFRVSKGDPLVGFRERWYHKDLKVTGDTIPMPVPSSYNDLSLDKEVRDHVGIVWYDRTFYVPDTWRHQGYNVWLRFGSVHYAAQVWVNGHLVMGHEIGHLPFQHDITSVLRFGGKNRVTVAVDNTLLQTTVPQGSLRDLNTDTGVKQIQAYTFDFFNYAGIHRSVHLYTTPTVYIDDITIQTDVKEDGTTDQSCDTMALHLSHLILMAMSTLFVPDYQSCDTMALHLSHLILMAMFTLFVPDCQAATGGILYPRESESREVRSLDGIWNFRVSKGDPLVGFRERWYHKDLKVWVNGHLVMGHEIGHLPFQHDITSVLRFGGKNRVTVAVDNTLLQTTVPQGTLRDLNTPVTITSVLRFGGKNRVTVAVDNTLLQTTVPQGSLRDLNTDTGVKQIQAYTFDFFNYAGIHRSVHLYTTPTVYIDDITIQTDVKEDGTTGTYYGMGMLKQRNFVNSGLSGTIEVPNARLWWPYLMNSEAGYLYTLQARLTGAQYSDDDIYRQPVGIRKLSWNATSFLINYKPIYIRGFGRHEDSDIRGKGLDLPLVTKDYELIKWVGANAYRTSHYPYAEEIMDFADQQGIMIINECPAVDIE